MGRKNEIFPFAELQKKGGKLSETLRLIAKCGKLIAGLKNSGDDNAVNETLSNLTKLKRTLNVIMGKRKKETFLFTELQKKSAILNKVNNPGEILYLIAKCEKSIASLKNNGDDDAISEFLSSLVKLKRILLDFFKEEQRKLLDKHWEQIREENEGFSRRISEQKEAIKKANEKEKF